jgi:hypothetical protein
MAHDVAHHDHAHHASADDEYRETPPGSTYEHTDANVWVTAKFLLWLAISAIIIHFGIGVLYELMIRQSMELEQPYPLAQGQEDQLPPAPRLQQFPANEYYQFRVGEEALLREYGWMNREAGQVHIPIDQAMRLTLERGVLQSVAPDPSVPVTQPGLIPADSSAGRTMERRRQ